MIRRRSTFLLCAVIVIVVACPVAALAQGGAVIIRIDDGTNHCISPRTEQVWLTLRRLITDKTKGWFTKDKSVSVIMKVTVSTDPQMPKPMSFPLMAQASFGGFSKGQVSVPVEYAIVSGLRLSQKEDNKSYLFTGLAVELTLLNKRGKNALGGALEALAEITDKLPIPASPVKQTTSYLLDLANSAVDKDLDDQHRNDKVKSAALALNFDPTGQCGGGQDDFEKTGTLAVLQSAGIKDKGYVPTNNTNAYCWIAELKPAFILKAALMKGRECKTVGPAEYIQVSNNYAGFFLNARSAGASGAAQGREAVARCAAHGVKQADCFSRPWTSGH